MVKTVKNDILNKNEIERIIRNKKIEYGFLSNILDTDIDLYISIYSEIFSGENNSYNTKYDLNPVIFEHMLVYIKYCSEIRITDREHMIGVIDNYLNEKIITECVDLSTIIHKIEYRFLNSTDKYLNELLDNGYKPSLGFIEQYYEKKIVNLNIEFFYKLLKCSKSNNIDIGVYVSTTISNGVIKKLIGLGFIIMVTFINSYIKRVDNNQKQFCYDTFKLLLKSCPTVDTTKVYTTLYKSIVLSGSLPLLEKFDFDYIDININHKIPISKMRYSKINNTNEFIFRELGVDFLKVLIKNGFQLKTDFLESYSKTYNMNKINFCLKILDKETMVDKDKYYLNIFNYTYKSNQNYNSYLIVKRITDKSILSDIVDKLIINEPLADYKKQPTI